LAATFPPASYRRRRALRVAVGTRATPLLTSSCPELGLTAAGYIAVDEHGMTNLPGVFAGGDIVRGSATDPRHG
jgi:thioredoxin reductase